MTFNTNTFTDDQLRAIVLVARERLPHSETCEQCEQRAAEDMQAVAAYRREIAEFNEHASVAGYLIPSKRTLVHRWDCPSMQAYLREVEDFRNGDTYEEAVAHGADLPMPTIATRDDAVAFIGSSKVRRGCKTCVPAL